MPSQFEHDARVRTAAFTFLNKLRDIYRDVFPRTVLAGGFEFEGRRVPLLNPQGIFKPAILSLPLSITTSPPSERKKATYVDEIGTGGLIRYKYRKDGPEHPDNLGLRRVMEQQLPLIYFRGLVPGRYFGAWPVYIVGDDRATETFSVAVDDRIVTAAQTNRAAESSDDVRRMYVTAAVKKRLHQRSFSERVINAYREHCAVCRLRHRELLEAAHILPDGHPKGLPIVPNGLALCKLHHAAFDAHILGVRPDYVIEIRTDILEEKDGPMLQHGLQGFNGQRLILPASPALHPQRQLLEERYGWFKDAS